MPRERELMRIFLMTISMGRRVKRLRETRNFSQRGLAINARVTQGLIHQIETGKVQDARSHAVVSPAPRRPVKEPLW